MHSKRFLIALVTEVIVVAAVIGLNFRCLMAQSTPEGNIYLYYEDHTIDNRIREELKLYAPTIWESVKGLEEVGFVTSGKAYSIVILMQPYTVGSFDPTTAEWVVIVSSIPEIGEEVKITIVRLDYRSFDLKRIDKFIYPVEKELSLEEVILILEKELREKDLLAPDEGLIGPDGKPLIDNSYVHKDDVHLFGGNYVYSVGAGDFGGKIFVDKYAGKPIFFAIMVMHPCRRRVHLSTQSPGFVP
ncbi:MAG: hypothetical protein AB1611_13795 [bacterium]